MSDRYLVAIPVFNEQNYVRSVLNRTLEHKLDILVIDDGSTDSTADILASITGIKVIAHAENFGYGRSIIDAFNFAVEHGYDWIITMDCDEQHEPAEIPGFIDAINKDDADIISGSRYLQILPGNDEPPADRLSINKRITAILNSRLGLALTDTFCGFKACRVEAIRKLRLTEIGYALPMQFWVQVAQAQLRVKEIPVKLVYSDPDRHFGGILDIPEIRYKHYLEVFEASLME